MDNNCNMKWLEWAKELQFLAQVGLTYTKDDFDKERYERIRAIAAEMMSLQSGLPLERVQDLFCNETGFQTPKMDTRAAIFSGNKILLVKEKNGKWSMPGGWVDVMQTIKSNTVKEVREEAGLDVEAVRIIAMQDRNKHNQPPYAYDTPQVSKEEMQNAYKHFTEQIIAISQSEQSYHEIFRKLNITRIEFDSLKSSSFYELKKK